MKIEVYVDGVKVWQGGADEIPAGKNPAAVALGRMGRGKKRSCTPEDLAARAERARGLAAKRTGLDV